MQTFPMETALVSESDCLHPAAMPTTVKKTGAINKLDRSEESASSFIIS